MDHIYVFATLFVVLALFIWGKFRHDLVALFALLALVIPGIIPAEKAFAGFGHPAVITVAVVLIIGKALENSGLIALLGKWVSKAGDNLTVQLLTLSSLVAFASAFMNNIGALAILMPVALSIAKKSGHPPSLLLMPLAFASLFGGMITLIGTPPNIIIATLRAREAGTPFGMFDFTPVGLALTIVGILVISLIGWRLLPKRSGEKSKDDAFKIDDYITEVLVSKTSKVSELSILELRKLTKADIQILGIVRNRRRMHAPGPDEVLVPNDIVILECDTQALKTLMDDTGVELVGDRKFVKETEGPHSIAISEAIVMADSPLVGQTTAGIRMRSRFGINLLAVSRRDKKIHSRLDHVVFRPGDVIMIQGRTQTIDEKLSIIGCLPLAERGLNIGYKKRITLSVSLFAASILLVITGILPVHVAFTLAAVGVVLTGVLPLKDMYTSIDWPVIVLLGAMLPVGEALETSGGAAIIVEQVLRLSEILPIWGILGVLLTITMLLSGVINNAATVVLMAPVGIGIANALNASIDPFLMAIAVGASAAFLTPIGHQSNTLVMGPGGYRFGDYFRLGLPLSILLILITVPLILYFWPV